MRVQTVTGGASFNPIHRSFLQPSVPLTYRKSITGGLCTALAKYVRFCTLEGQILMADDWTHCMGGGLSPLALSMA